MTIYSVSLDNTDVSIGSIAANEIIDVSLDDNQYLPRGKYFHLRICLLRTERILRGQMSLSR
jgi:hypothetical protein